MAPSNWFTSVEDLNKKGFTGTLSTLLRKQRGTERAIQQRHISLEIYVKGGFMRSDNLSCLSKHPMKDLMEKCTVDIAANLIENNRKIVGQAVVRVEVNTPIKSAEEVATPVEFVCLERHKESFLKFFMSSPSGKLGSGIGTRLRTSPSGPERPSSVSSSTKTNGMPKIRAKKVILYENQINQAIMKSYKDKNTKIPDAYLNVDAKLKKEYNLVEKWLEKAKSNEAMLAHYIKCVRESLDQYTSEYESMLSIGARDLDSKKMYQRIEIVKLELAAYGEQSYV